MGVEYKHYLIPHPNSFFPNPEQVISLLNELATEGWIIDPKAQSFGEMEFNGDRRYKHAQASGAYAQTPDGYSPFPFPFQTEWIANHLQNDLILCWPVENFATSGLEYPFTNSIFEREQIYFNFQLHFGADYVYHTSELIDPFDEPVRCESCKAELNYWLEDDPQPHSLASGKMKDIFYAARIRSVCEKCRNPLDISKRSVVVRDGWRYGEKLVAGGASYRFAMVVDCGKCLPSDDGPATLEPSLVEIFQDELGCTFYEIGDLY